MKDHVNYLTLRFEGMRKYVEDVFGSCEHGHDQLADFAIYLNYEVSDREGLKILRAGKMFFVGAGRCGIGCWNDKRIDLLYMFINVIQVLISFTRFDALYLIYNT